LAQAGGDTAYVELLAKPGHRKARAADANAPGPDEEPQA